MTGMHFACPACWNKIAAPIHTKTARCSGCGYAVVVPRQTAPVKRPRQTRLAPAGQVAA